MKKAVLYPNIEAERARIRLTTAEIAKKLGVTRKTYELWGIKGNIPASALIEMSKIFDCSTDYLLSLDTARR